jgi:methylglyoxal synthase
MEKVKRIGLVAHDNRKKDLVEWVEWNFDSLSQHKLICTGTTGKLVQEVMEQKLEAKKLKDFRITRLKSGPLGGDQQLGALITEGKIDLLIFLWDPMEPQPHDVDVKALLRIAVLYNVPTACNRATADFMISSPLLDEEYQPIIKDYEDYVNRKIPES